MAEIEVQPLTEWKRRRAQARAMAKDAKRHEQDRIKQERRAARLARPLRLRPPRDNELSRRQTARARARLLLFVGNRCQRCGYDQPRALQVDHIAGDGYRDRPRRRRLTIFYAMVLESMQRGEDRYQILCANCNAIKAQTHDREIHRLPGVAGAEATLPLFPEENTPMLAAASVHGGRR